ncbi:MAG: hypothetical protein RR585_00755 [Coprobacillus sp.]
MKKVIMFVLGLLLIITLVLFPKLDNNNLVNINNQDSISNSILKIKGYNSINIVKEKKYYNYYAVIYKPSPPLDNSEENLELLIYRKAQSFSSNNYEYYGGATSSKNFNTFNGNEKGKETMIIVYGDNRLVKAHSYSITNSETTYKKNIEQDFILDIYVLRDTDNCSSVNKLYDEKEKVLDIF